MAIQEFTPFEQAQPAEATVWPVEGFEPFHQKDKPIEFYVSVGTRALGLVHWEASRNNIGYIDGIDPHEGIEEDSVRQDEWEAIAVAMHATIKEREARHIARIEHPGGIKIFLEAI